MSPAQLAHLHVEAPEGHLSELELYNAAQRGRSIGAGTVLRLLETIADLRAEVRAGRAVRS